MKALIIGNLQRDSIINTLRINKLDYSIKLLTSGIENWKLIISLIKTKEYFVVWKFMESDMMMSCKPGYQDIFFELIQTVKEVEHLVLIYKENLDYRFNFISNRNLLKYDLSNKNEVIEIFNNIITYTIESDLNYFTYKFSQELEVITREYIEMNNNGFILKFYIPNKRLMSNELLKITDLFEKYLNSLYNLKFVVQKRNTKTGCIVEFYSDSEKIEFVKKEWNDFPLKIEEFSLSINKSKAMIINSNLNDESKENLARILNVESKRIIVDINFALKQKNNELEYLIENNILEFENKGIITNINNKVLRNINNMIPNNASTTIVENFTYINNIEGNIINNDHDEKIMDIIHSISDVNERNELISIFNELNDSNIEELKKISSGEKIKRFLRKSMHKIGDATFQLLISYIESKFS